MIAVVDFGAGNTRSVLRALLAVGAPATLVATGEELAQAERVVLPGVGSAASAVAELHRRGLWEPLREWGAAGRPLFGICLGAQLLLERSQEGGAIGLGLLGGVCRAFPDPAAGGPKRVPHIGWNVVRLRGGPAVEAYFVHGYWLDPADPGCVLGTSEVDGFSFPSLLRRGGLIGAQFHPEKSGAFGRALLAAFAGGQLDEAPATSPAVARGG